MGAWATKVRPVHPHERDPQPTMSTTTPPAAPPRADRPEDALRARLAGLKTDLARHRLADLLRDRGDLVDFMEHHVLCVWDFMCLLKSLQRELTCVDVPWVPPADPQAARMLNELVLAEESDLLAEGGLVVDADETASHFAWYRRAMDAVGCDGGPIDRFVEGLRAGGSARELLDRVGFPPAARAFVGTTLDVLEEPLAVRVAVFYHGREDLIPELMEPLVERLQDERGGLDLLLGYLRRHVVADRDEHGPLCARLLERQLAARPDLERPALVASLAALEARRELWDALARSCEARGASAEGAAG